MSFQILIVDDDTDARESLAEALTTPTIEVHIAADGQEALDLIRVGRIRPSLILLDLRMPGMDGVSFLQHHAIDPRTGTIPVIVLSAETSIAKELVGAVLAVLPKPTALPRLRDIIDALRQDPLRYTESTRTPWDQTGDVAAAPGRLERRQRQLQCVPSAHAR